MTATAQAEAAARDIVAARLAADGLADNPAAHLVLAALDGPDAVDALVEDGVLPEGAAEAAAAAEPLGAYITSIAVEGFRGVGPRATLELTPGPGLTLVIGRNGSGKSSFAVWFGVRSCIATFARDRSRRVMYRDGAWRR